MLLWCLRGRLFLVGRGGSEAWLRQAAQLARSHARGAPPSPVLPNSGAHSKSHTEVARAQAGSGPGAPHRHRLAMPLAPSFKLHLAGA